MAFPACGASEIVSGILFRVITYKLIINLYLVNSGKCEY